MTEPSVLLNGSWGWDCHDCGMSVQSCPAIFQLLDITNAHVCPVPVEFEQETPE